MKPKDLSALLDELACAHNREVQTMPRSEVDMMVCSCALT
jgi:hypothetical protein